MLFLKPYNTWRKPTELSLEKLRETITETKELLKKSQQQLQDYDLKYELYQKWQSLKPQLVKIDKLYSELYQLDQPFKRLFYRTKINDLKTKIEMANSTNKQIEGQCLFNNFFTPDFFADDLAWETKDNWDINHLNNGIYTYTSKTKLMDKEVGKKWMTENEFGRLEKYLEQLCREMERRVQGD